MTETQGVSEAHGGSPEARAFVGPGRAMHGSGGKSKAGGRHGLSD